MIVKLLTERRLEFLNLKGGCRGSSESTPVKMSNCWKSHAAAQFMFLLFQTYCHAIGGKLATIEDASEQQFLIGHLGTIKGITVLIHLKYNGFPLRESKDNKSLTISVRTFSL